MSRMFNDLINQIKDLKDSKVQTNHSFPAPSSVPGDAPSPGSAGGKADVSAHKGESGRPSGEGQMSNMDSPMTNISNNMSNVVMDNFDTNFYQVTRYK